MNINKEVSFVVEKKSRILFRDFMIVHLAKWSVCGSKVIFAGTWFQRNFNAWFSHYAPKDLMLLVVPWLFRALVL